ncbi:hypothetical protein SK571_42135 [Lentzea sp. BCCO 10_0798]|uniref:DUF1990 domain-containing protein n=1 Tax=Lentzea kristufekii TaxID=3095430 RepID=A0ABU4U629_9PSEU|nr:hypothetical protein [Lentzea sp. BCCO 10_0798]MDX8056018.1 hypothetical protein [Lentzea sp. BCCO 10_0798]
MSDLLNSYFAGSPLPEFDAEQAAEAQRKVAAGVFEIRFPDPGQPAGAPLGRESIMGSRTFGPDGLPTGEEWRNAHFIPHPETAGTEVTNAFELDLWRVTKGFARGASLISALLKDVTLTVSAHESGELRLFDQQNGMKALHVFSSPRRHPADLVRAVPITGTQLVEVFGHDQELQIVFNPASAPTFTANATLFGALLAGYLDLIERHAARQAPTTTTPTAAGTIAAPEVPSGAQA